MVEKEDNKQDKMPEKFDFNYIKSNYFRVVHSDGVIGNLTPKNDIFVGFFNERHSLPDKVSFEITPEGELGKEKERVTTSEGIFREVEVGVVIDLEQAKTIVVWLSGMINQAEKLIRFARTAEDKKQ